MKKVTIVSLFIFSLFLHVQNLNLISLSAEPQHGLENHENIAMLLNACQNNSKFAQEKMDAICNCLKTEIICMCSLTEKLELREFAKTPGVFKKLFSELIGKIAGVLKIEPAKLKSFTQNMHLDVTQAPGKGISSTKPNMLIEKIASKLLVVSGEQLIISISKIILFLNPASKDPIGLQQVKDVLLKTLSSFTDSELVMLEKAVNAKAFTKISNNLDKLIDRVLLIIKN